MRKLILVLISAAGVAACNPRPLFMQPRPMREWPAALQAAKEAARAGRYAQADSVLARFESRNPGSYEARQAAYWRALFLVDPANTQASKAEALRALNQYFAEGSTDSTYDEASVLRRVVQDAERLTRELAQTQRLVAEAREAAAAAPAAAVPAQGQTEARESRENRNLVDEVKRLRDELAKANQELERVRKRLSGQRP
jgi:hypothetical protein